MTYHTFADQIRVCGVTQAIEGCWIPWEPAGAYGFSHIPLKSAITKRALPQIENPSLAVQHDMPLPEESILLLAEGPVDCDDVHQVHGPLQVHLPRAREGPIAEAHEPDEALAQPVAGQTGSLTGEHTR